MLKSSFLLAAFQTEVVSGKIQGFFLISHCDVAPSNSSPREKMDKEKQGKSPLLLGGRMACSHGLENHLTLGYNDSRDPSEN